MSATNDGGPASPKAGLDPWHRAKTVCTGMTLRDYFAAKALQGLLANSGGPIQSNGMSGWDFTNCNADNVAELCFTMAEAMLNAREVQS